MEQEQEIEERHEIAKYRITLRVKNSSTKAPWFWDMETQNFRATPMSPQTEIPEHALRRQLELARQRCWQNLDAHKMIYALCQEKIKAKSGPLQLSMF